MFFYGTEWFIIRTLVVVALAVVVWRQNQRLKAAEFELTGLRELFLSLRARLEEGAPPPKPATTVAPAAVVSETANAKPEAPREPAKAPSRCRKISKSRR